MSAKHLRRDRQKGFSLIELMVSLVLSLLLMFGVVQLFVANKLTFNTQQGLGQVVENGRFAVDRLAAAVRGAGFFGCSGVAITAPTVLASSVPAGLAGIGSASAVSGCENYGNVSCSISLPARAGTDVIVARGAGRDGIGFTQAQTAVGDAVPVAAGYTNFAVGDLVLINDCEGADLFRVTGVSPGPPLLLGHDAGDNSEANLSKLFQSDATVAKVYEYAYFVGGTGRSNTAGEAILALYRRNLDTGDDEELVEGISDLQASYGIDQDGNRRADRYVDAQAVSNWSQVVSVDISVLADSVESRLQTAASYSFAGSTITPSTDDLRLYKEFTALASLRNKTL